jgi:hypothetical protein
MATTTGDLSAAEALEHLSLSGLPRYSWGSELVPTTDESNKYPIVNMPGGHFRLNVSPRSVPTLSVDELRYTGLCEWGHTVNQELQANPRRSQSRLG